MISKKISCEPENDNFARLADYIAGGNHTNEKVFSLWTASCWAGDDYQWATREIVDTQSLNNRTKQTKTYHLVVSFRPEDEAKLTPEVLKYIEMHFAKAMNLEEHQRVCGVHQNTDNMHMHVGYNLIHPEKLTIHTPFQDYIARDRVCREMELKYGISIDNGIATKRDPQKLTNRAATVEAQSGEQSFESYVKEQRDSILESLNHASCWYNVHRIMGKFNMDIKQRGNGLIIEDKSGKFRIKASTLDRSLSYQKLVTRFGEYTPYKGEPIIPTKAYQKKPIQKGRMANEYYRRYQNEVGDSWQKFHSLRTEEKATLDPIKKKWKAKRLAITCRPISRKLRFKLLAIVRQKEKEEIQTIRDTFQREHLRLKQERPYHSWCDFLSKQALQGDEVALAILRSKKVEVRPETPMFDERRLLEKQKFDAQLRQKEKEIVASNLSTKFQRPLLGIQRMKKALFNSEQSFTSRIDTKGVIIYTLKNGGVIRDTGKELHFSSKASAVACDYAHCKWGDNININLQANKISFKVKERLRFRSR